MEGQVYGERRESSGALTWSGLGKVLELWREQSQLVARDLDREGTHDCALPSRQLDQGQSWNLTGKIDPTVFSYLRPCTSPGCLTLGAGLVPSEALRHLDMFLENSLRT